MKLLLKNCIIITRENGVFKEIKDGYLGIDGSVINYIGAEKPAAAYDEEKDMHGKMLLPGLINTHAHSAMTLLRGLGSDLPLQEWLFDNMFPVEDRLTTADIDAGNRLALLEMLACGTTSFCDMYMEPRLMAAACKDAGMKANLCRPVQEFDPNGTYAENTRAKESLAFFKEMNGTDEGRLHVDFSIHAEYTCNTDVVRGYSADCADLGGRMHIHMSETKKEHDECVAKYGKTPAQWFDSLGTFASPTYAAHCVWVTKEDMDIMQAKGVSAMHNPTSNMKLGSGYAPIPEMLERGINVALGTDGCASNNNVNMWEEMHLAAVLHNGYHQDAVIMNPQQVLTMATVNGAKLQGREDTGELVVGKKADIIAIDLDKPHLMPNLDSMALITYAAQGSDVCMTMIDGRIVYENGIYKTLDAEKIMADVKAAVARLYA